MVVLWATGMQPKPRVDKGFLLALMPVALFHTVGHVSACVSFSQVCGWQTGTQQSVGELRCNAVGAVCAAHTLEPLDN
jgi:hypothetical protein